MRRTLIIIAVALGASGVAGCTNPYDPGQRALGGGLIGGAGGAAIGGLAGGGTGALIGGGIGAAGGRRPVMDIADTEAHRVDAGGKAGHWPRHAFLV